MRKIVAGLFISLDGVYERPDQWHFPYFNDEMGNAVDEQMAAADAMLLGRVTYEEFAGYVAGLARACGLARRAGTDADDVAAQLIATADGIAVQALFHPDAWPPERQRSVLHTMLASLGLAVPARE